MSSAGRHDPSQARAVWPPEVGFFQLRLVRGGWLVPARILLTDDGWSAEIDGTRHIPHHDPAHAQEVDFIWTWGTMIDEAQHRWLVAIKDHALAHDPDHPSLKPYEPINPMLLRPLIPRPKGPK